jgi:hypothetical protein
MSGLPEGTVTFLFSDIEGSTELLRRLGQDRYGKALADYLGALYPHHSAYVHLQELRLLRRPPDLRRRLGRRLQEVARSHEPRALW